MKKIITAVLALLCVAATLASCAPAGNYVEETTEKPLGILGTPDIGGSSEFKDYTVCSDNYAMYSGEYYYFFFTFLSEFVNNYDGDRLAELGFDKDTSLKEQSLADGSRTWYEFFRDITVEYMENILLCCEEAKKSGSSYTKDSQTYVNALKSQLNATAKENGITFNELIYQMFGGNVTPQSYLNALQMEFIYKAYFADKYAQIYSSVTVEDAKEYAQTLEGEKDMTPTRHIAFVSIDDGEERAKAFCEEFRNAATHDKETLESLAKAKDYIFNTMENNTTTSITAADTSNWLFAQGREIGDFDTVLVKDDGYYVMLYYGDGYETYVAQAIESLAEKRTDEHFESLKAVYNLKYDEEKLDSLNA